MAKQKKAVLLLTVILASGTGRWQRSAAAAELRVAPTLAVSEEYNDNINESAVRRQTDFVTSVQPGISLAYTAAQLAASAAYHLEYLNFARGAKGDEVNHRALVTASAQLVPNFFYLEVSDTLSRVSIDVARDVTAESAFVNQTDQNTASISPYLRWRLTEKSVLKTGYRYRDTRYWGGSSGIDKMQHTGFTELNHDLSERLHLSAGYSFSSVDTELLRYDQHDISASGRYEYAEKCFLYGGIGNSWQSFSDSRSSSNLLWNAGISHDFRLLTATLEAAEQYTEDPLTASTRETRYRATLGRSFSAGSVDLSASYSEFGGTDTSGLNRRSTAFGATGRYDFSPRLSASLAATADRVNGSGVDSYPYHFNGSAGMQCTFNYDITASLTYHRVEYRHEIDSSAGARQTNRVLLEVRKAF